MFEFIVHRDANAASLCGMGYDFTILFLSDGTYCAVLSQWDI